MPKSFFMKKISFFIICLITIACNESSLDKALKYAGSNRQELEKVLEYYKKLNDPQKYEAACFLIRNMPGHLSYYGKDADLYNEQLSRIGNYPSKDRLFAWDSLTKVNKILQLNQLKMKEDIHIIKADYLIENIEYAFKAWHEMPWGNRVNFSDFCNYILPYRTDNEQLENWRAKTYSQFKKLVEDSNFVDPFIIYNTIKLLHEKDSFTVCGTSQYPMSLNMSQIRRTKSGLCNDMCNLNLMAMRSIALPVTKDGATWVNYNLGHSWNALLLNKDSLKPIKKMVAELAFVPDYGKTKRFLPREIAALDERTAARIIRSGYSIQNSNELFKYYNKGLDGSYISQYGLNVADLYFNTETLNIKVNAKTGLVYLCTFHFNGFRKVNVTEIKKGNACFTKVVPNIVYFPMIYNESGPTPCAEPFLLKQNGQIKTFSSNKDEKQTMYIYRKAPILISLFGYSPELINSEIQAANNPKFNYSTKLFVIKTAPVTMTKVDLNINEKYRYIRVLTKGLNCFAEFEVYGINNIGDTIKLTGKLIYSEPGSGVNRVEAAFDGNWDTYSFLPPNSWFGLDLGAAYKIVKIKYCPRTDTNMIIDGNDYELSYWGIGWKFIERRIGKDDCLVFKNAPANAIYWLHNYTGGHEERIFTYENGLQVWW